MSTMQQMRNYCLCAFMKLHYSLSLVLGGSRLMKLPRSTKDLRTFQCGKKPLKLAVKCFPKTGEKQMRDLKAKPAVSTLKSVHTNYFPEGVSTLFPLCCQQRHSLGCRRALSLPLPGNAQQHPISILICSQSIITPLSSI